MRHGQPAILGTQDIAGLPGSTGIWQTADRKVKTVIMQRLLVQKTPFESVEDLT